MEYRDENEEQYEARSAGKSSDEENTNDSHKPRGAKRKSKDTHIQKKRPKVANKPPITIQALQLFKELAPIPRYIIQPPQVHRIYPDRMDNSCPDIAFHLTRLFLAVASLDAFCQLRDACIVAREDGEHPTDQSITQTIRALDRPEVAVSKIHIQRRYFLTNLLTHRNEFEETHLRQRPERAVKAVRARNNQSSWTSGESFGHASSLALKDLMSSAYPDLKPTRHTRVGGNDEYQTKLKSLKSKLAVGRNWDIM